MRIEQLNHFVQVANHRSISKAAKTLFIAQPSLSTSITTLENELDTKLFHRTRNGVDLTPQGKKVLEYSQNIIDQYQQIMQVVNGQDSLSGEVSLSATPSACGTVVLDLIVALRELHPNLSLHIDETRPSKVVDKIFSGEAIFGITSYLNFEKEVALNNYATKSIKSENLFSDALCLYVHHNHPLALASTTTATLSEASKYPFVSFKHDTLVEKLSNYSTKINGVDELEIIYRFNNYESIKKVIAERIAITLCPKSSAYNDLYVQDGLLVPLDVTDIDLSLTSVLIYRNNAIFTPEEREVISLIKNISSTM